MLLVYMSAELLAKLQVKNPPKLNDMISVKIKPPEQKKKCRNCTKN